MRWFWIDRFIEFTSGRSATAIKNVTLAEEHLHDHMPGFPYMPATLIVEGLAQTGGLLVAQLSDFRSKVVLAKVARSEFPELAVPGDTLHYHASIENVSSDGSIVAGHCTRGGQSLATVELMFAHLGDEFADVELFDPGLLARMLKSLKLFDVARTADGNSIEMPPFLAHANQQTQ